MTDFTFVNEGTILLLWPHTEAADIWVEEHIPDDATRFQAAVVIEHRYFDPIAAGIEADGLTIEEA